MIAGSAFAEVSWNRMLEQTRSKWPSWGNRCGSRPAGRELHALAERLGARVRIAQQRAPTSIACTSASGEGVDERRRAVADGAAHVEGCAAGAARMALADELRRRAADVVVVRAHHAERIQVDAAVVERADREVVGTAFATVAAGHAVDVDAGDVLRQRQARVEAQRAERLAAAARGEPARALEQHGQPAPTESSTTSQSSSG